MGSAAISLRPSKSGFQNVPFSEQLLGQNTPPSKLEKGWKAHDQRDSRIGISVIHGRSAFGGPTMLTAMTEEDWTVVLGVFEASRSRRGEKGRDDRRFLSALHYFVVHNITWRALPAEFGNWNSVWKRFWRLSQSGVFEAFFEALAAGGQQAQTVRPPKLLGSRRAK
jgi:transposase